MSWSLPFKVGERNIDYAKHCLEVAKHSIVCGYTMKTKAIEHEQYCKHYEPKEEKMVEFYEKYDKERIEELECMIIEYERHAENE